MSDIRPKIVVFCCNWSAYPAVDMVYKASSNLLPHVKFIKIMCGGMVTRAYILRAFELGADGVLIATCHTDDCHYITGARRAVDVYNDAEKLLGMLGIGSERLRLGWFSAHQPRMFGTALEEFMTTIKATGPTPIATAVH